jgi:hypothetical protein
VQSAAARGTSWHPRRIRDLIVALSQLQLNVLRTVAIADAVPVSVLVGYQQKETGARPSVARASLSRSLRRVWRVGAVELRGTRASLSLGHATTRLADSTARRRRRSLNRLMWRHIAHSSMSSPDPIPDRVYVRGVTITKLGRDLLVDADDGRFPVWTPEVDNFRARPADAVRDVVQFPYSQTCLFAPRDGGIQELLLAVPQPSGQKNVYQ